MNKKQTKLNKNILIASFIKKMVNFSIIFAPSFFILGCSLLASDSSVEYSDSFTIDSSQYNPSVNGSSDQQLAPNIESFLFFTDPHLFRPNYSFDIDYEWFDINIPILSEAKNESNSQFIVCGGDLLNYGDTKEQALYKLSYFKYRMSLSFDNFYYIVGNHDTNYQGDKYIANGNYEDCIISNEEMSEIMFDGGNAYYSFSTELVTYYCFDSGIDWDFNKMTNYRWQQIDWFANCLLQNTKKHLTVLIHIPMKYSNGDETAFTTNLGRVISKFNSKEKLVINEKKYDYSSSLGRIDFVLGGHIHEDSTNYYCGGVPIITTTSFMTDDSQEQYAFDCLLIDYNNSVVNCKRYGKGEDRRIII